MPIDRAAAETFGEFGKASLAIWSAGRQGAVLQPVERGELATIKQAVREAARKLGGEANGFRAGNVATLASDAGNAQERAESIEGQRGEVEGQASAQVLPEHIHRIA